MGLPKLVCLKTTAGLQISPTSLIPPNLALRPYPEEPGSLYQQLGDWGKQIFSFWQFCFVSFSRGGEGTGWISVDLLGQLAPEGTWHTPQKQHRLKQSSRDGPRKQRDRPPRSGCQRLFRWADRLTEIHHQRCHTKPTIIALPNILALLQLNFRFLLAKDAGWCTATGRHVEALLYHALSLPE